MKRTVVFSMPLKPDSADTMLQLESWWRSIAQITKEESPLLYEMSAPAREWAKKNGYPHAP
jgi:hypothetical protein